MKASVKLFSLLLALLILAMCFTACGGTTETETEPQGKETESETVVETETEDPRLAVKDDVPTDLNFANDPNNTVTFLGRSGSDFWEHEIDVDEITDDSLWDAIYRRNQTVENRLGVTITVVNQECTFAARNEWFQTFRNAVNTKSGDFDAGAIYISQGAPLALEGMYYNLIDFPNISLEKPWWNQALREETTIFDTCFFLAGDIAVSSIAGTVGWFYNKTLWEKLNPGQEYALYDYVDNGEWTVELMYDLMENVWEDTNASGVIDDGDVVGMAPGDTINQPGMDSWIPALGLNVTVMEEGYPVLALYDERSVSAFEKVQDLFLNNPSTLKGSGYTQTSFSSGNILFHRASLSYGTFLRDMKDPYGVLPFPKFDEEQKNYGTTISNGESMVALLSSLPDDRLDMVGATVELMGAESYKQVTPVFYDVMLKSKFSDSPRDAEMYDLILESVVVSFGYVYSTTSLNGIGSVFRDPSRDFAQWYESNATQFETSLEILLDKLDELSYNLLYGGK